MEYFLDFVIFYLGAAIGSFLNVVACRLETGESFWNGRSRCPDCGKNIRWFDLFPLASFLFLRARCRHCAEKISWQYFAAELVSGLAFLAYWIKFGPSPDFLFVALIFSFLLIIFFFDARHYIIPDKVIVPAVIAVLAFRILTLWSSGDLFSALINPFLAGVGAAIFFLLLIAITRGKGMGMGDAKLGFLLGWWLGWPKIVPALFLAFAVGAIVGIFLVAFGRKQMKSMIPFGPFLVAGAAAASLFSDDFIAKLAALF